MNQVYLLEKNMTDLFTAGNVPLGVQLLWAKQLGGTGNESGNAIALDSNDNIYITGAFSETADFDPGAGTFNLTAQGSSDIFIAKFNSDGSFVWAKQLGGIGNDSGSGITVDSNGNVYATGTFSDTVDFDPGAGETIFTATGNDNVFTTKLNSDGSFAWAKQLGGRGVAVDKDNNVYTRGTFPSITTSTTTDIIKLDDDGTLIWGKALAGAGADFAIDSNSNIYIAGLFRGTADFDPGTGTYNLTAQSFPVPDGDAFVTKLNSDGSFAWAKQLGGNGFDWCTGIAVDSNSNVYTTGRFSGIGDFDPGPGTYNLVHFSQSSLPAFFLSKLNSDGSFAWAKQSRDANIAQGLDIALDSKDNIYTSSWINGSASFQTGTGSVTLKQNGSGSFLSQFNSDGTLAWGKEVNYVSPLAVDSNGNIYTTGSFSDTADFDPNSGTFNLTSAGQQDAFIAKFGTVPLSSISIDDAAIAEGNDGTKNLTFTVSLSQPTIFPISVDYFTNDGTAVAGSDYTAKSGTLTFTPGGSLTQTIDIEIKGDNITELDEFFNVGLFNAVNATISNGGIGTIQNDDTSLPIGNTPPAIANLDKSDDEDNEIAFVPADFQNKFIDGEANPLNKIKITSLPLNGTLRLGANNIALNQEILADELGNLRFIPDANWNGSTSFNWNGSDGTSYAATDATVNLTVNPVNDAPAINLTIAAQNATVDNLLAIAFPADTFKDIDAGDSLTYSATLANGNPLPAWLNFDANSRSLFGTPTSTDIGNITVFIQTTDTANAIASTSFVLTVNPSQTNFFDSITRPNLDNLPAPLNSISNEQFGTDDSDTLIGTNLNDALYGLGGNDLLLGNAGEDRLFGGKGNDIIVGGANNDLLYGGRERDLLWGDKGNDTVSGDRDNDTLFGGFNDVEGQDLLLGGEGDDLLSGNQGKDTLFGDAGNDTLHGGQNDDILLGGSENDLLLGEKGNDSLDGGVGDDSLYGGSEQDYLRGNTGNDLLSGNQGEDGLYGDEGNDTLRGGKDDDTLIGGKGDDRLVGDLGKDLLEGGLGSDRFVISSGKGIDALVDFTDGLDLIELAGNITFSELNISAGINSTSIGIAQTGEILAILNGVSADLITQSDFVLG